MLTQSKSKNPLRDYRKLVVIVLTKYFAVNPDAVRFRVNALRTHRAHGDSPAYVALLIGRTCKLPLATATKSKNGGRS